MHENLWESVKIHQNARTQTGSRPSGFVLIFLWFVTTPPRELKTKTVNRINSKITFSRPAELLSVTVQLRFRGWPELRSVTLQLRCFGVRDRLNYSANYFQLLYSYGLARS